MIDQPGFDWQRDVNLPVSGRSPRAHASSATGAQVAARTRGAVALAYRRLLIESGPLSDYEAARALGRLVSSICSTRNGWGDHVVASDQVETTPWGSQRTKWAWVEQKSWDRPTEWA
jgi:hypothetical protein